MYVHPLLVVTELVLHLTTIEGFPNAYSTSHEARRGKLGVESCIATSSGVIVVVANVLHLCTALRCARAAAAASSEVEQGPAARDGGRDWGLRIAFSRSVLIALQPRQNSFALILVLCLIACVSRAAQGVLARVDVINHSITSRARPAIAVGAPSAIVVIGIISRGEVVGPVVARLVEALVRHAVVGTTILAAFMIIPVVITTIDVDSAFAAS